MTRKFKLAVKKFKEKDGIKIIRNSENEKAAITNLMNECGFTKRIAKKIVRTKIIVLANIDISKL